VGLSSSPWLATYLKRHRRQSTIEEDVEPTSTSGTLSP
jgi:hypothetical protein